MIVLMYAGRTGIYQCRHIGMIPIQHEGIDGGHTSQNLGRESLVVLMLINKYDGGAVRMYV